MGGTLIAKAKGDNYTNNDKKHLQNIGSIFGHN